MQASMHTRSLVCSQKRLKSLLYQSKIRMLQGSEMTTLPPVPLLGFRQEERLSNGDTPADPSVSFISKCIHHSIVYCKLL